VTEQEESFQFGNENKELGGDVDPSPRPNSFCEVDSRAFPWRCLSEGPVLESIFAMPRFPHRAVRLWLESEFYSKLHLTRPVEGVASAHDVQKGVARCVARRHATLEVCGPRRRSATGIE